MTATPGTVSSPTKGVDLQTLVSAVQRAVIAQNLIATNIANLATEASSGSANVTTAISTGFAALTAAFEVAFPPPITGSSAWTPGGIANGASAAISFTVTGAALGKFVASSLAEDLKGCSLTAYVASANTVEAVIGNQTGSTVTFAATTINVKVGS